MFSKYVKTISKSNNLNFEAEVINMQTDQLCTINKKL